MNIDKQALRTDMLIVNALETAKQLRELQESPVAESIFESIVENENGKEIQFERPISDLAYAAFLKIESLVEALEAAEQANKLAQEATEKLVQERNALAAENTGLKDALNDILQPDAAVLERNHRVRALDAMETPATDAFLAEVRAQGVEMFGSTTIKFGEEEGDEDIIYAGNQALLFAAQIRREAAQ